MSAPSTPPILVLTLFGPVEAHIHGKPLPRLRSRKGLGLLALLALRHGATIERSWLAGTLWPESAEPQALASLRITLKDLRQALGEAAGALRSPTARTLALDLAAAAVDVVAFDAAIARGDAATLGEAVALYRGPLLEGWLEEWAFQERQVREQAYLRALQTLAAQAVERREFGEAERWLRRVVAVDPTREGAQRSLMEALAAGGAYAAAVEVYRELREHLLRELNAEPDAQTRAVYEQVRAEARRRAKGTEGGSERGGERAQVPHEFASLSASLAPSSASGEATVTFLFTDVEGSTRLWEAYPQAMRLALARHDALLRRVLAHHGGAVFKTVGDQFCAAFDTAPEAVAAARAAQRELVAQDWTDVRQADSLPGLRVRIAVHTGTAELREGDYFGPPLNRVARLLEAAHGGQILLSRASQELAHDTLPAGATLRDLGEYRLRDLPRPERIFQLVAPDLPGVFPPLRSAEARPNNLPTFLTTFIGRQREVAALRELLGRPEARLITITGPGGGGKTRLAQAVAVEGATQFADGVWFTSLDDAAEPGSILPQIAAAVQLPLLPDRPPREQLLAFLAPRALLLVLDGFERVVDAAPLVADLLQAAPGVRCLVTSQIALRLRGEHVFSLTPLQTPPAGLTALEPLRAFDSVLLFEERAAAVRTDFTLSARNAPTIAEICRRLDGIPLGIELAAAQCVDMSLTEILAGLGARLDLLESDSADLPARHRTLRTVMDWSYSLLTPVEQRVLQQLAVFAGGWYREAAQAVCGAEALPALRVLHRHSLLNTSESPDGRMRSFLLETVRQYAHAHLHEDTEQSHAVAARHAAYYLAFAEGRVERMRTRDEARMLQELVEELDNLRAALEWSREQPEGEFCARLALTTFEPLYRHGFWQEARACLQIGLAAAPHAAERTALQAAIRHGLAMVAHDMGDLGGKTSGRDQPRPPAPDGRSSRDRRSPQPPRPLRHR
jgi:predicted ATPase/class 3 adenylate cyclase